MRDKGSSQWSEDGAESKADSVGGLLGKPVVCFVAEDGEEGHVDCVLCILLALHVWFGRGEYADEMGAWEI